MTDEQARALGQRWMACRWFRWEPRMVDGSTGCTIIRPDDDYHGARGWRERRVSKSMVSMLDEEE